MTEKAHDSITPGEILLEEFLIPLGISQYRLAKTIGVPPRRINEIVHGNLVLRDPKRLDEVLHQDLARVDRGQLVHRCHLLSGSPRSRRLRVQCRSR
jgi:hypothetical protein